MTRVLCLPAPTVSPYFATALAVALISFSAFFFGAPQAHAAELTAQQVDAILSLLQSFGAEQATINEVAADLGGVPPVQENGSLTVSIDASSPGYQIAAGGTAGVTLGVFRFAASGEDISLRQIGLNLA